MDETTRRAFDVELRLRGLAEDILEHEGCEGCRINAAQALEFLGTLEDTLQRLGVEDPREAHQRKLEEQRAQAAAGRPPRLRLSLEAEIVVGQPSEEMQARLSSALPEAVEKAVGNLRGATLVGWTMGITDSH